MTKAYCCTVPDCGKVFSKAYELKKHTVAHENPSRVSYCPECDFITLQKKNLAIHIAIHTGEKIHRCPHLVDLEGSSGSTSRAERCDYRTNDPAALTKHRKKLHGYIPPVNRRSATAKPYQKRDRKPPRQTYRADVDPGYISTSTESSKGYPLFFSQENTQSICSDTSGYDSSAGSGQQDSPAPCTNPSPFLWRGDVDPYESPVTRNPPVTSGYDPSLFNPATFMSPYEMLEQDTLYDASLHSQWMAKYEQGYSNFHITGLTYRYHLGQEPSILHLDTSIGQAGHLCPEWATQAGREDWQQSILESDKEFYAMFKA